MDGSFDPVAPTFVGRATFGNNASVDTTGLEIIPANPKRQMGVWLKNTGGTNNLLVGDATGTAVMPISPTSAGTFPLAFIPGTGPIFVKSAASTTGVSWYWL